MFKILPIVLLSTTQKVTHYAQYYAHNYCNYATVHTQLIIFNDCINIVIGSMLLYFTLCYAAVFLYLTYYAHEKTCASFCTMLA